MTDGCVCEPCLGRGNDGHGMEHCAECCFGTGVIPDLDCPTHGDPRLSAAQMRLALRIASAMGES